MDAATLSKYQDLAIQFGLKILAAIAIWIIGRWLIRLVVRLINRALHGRKIDPTVLRYIGSSVSVLLNVVLVIAILGYFGIQTATFAALIAAAGLAIGMAWSGLLANFAAGVFLILLRPFKVGDFISAGGVTGNVGEVGLFVTSIVTPDNVHTLVPNNKLFSDTIQNFSANPYRRVELKAQLAGAADLDAAAARLKQNIAAIPNVKSKPGVDVEILEFNLLGPVLAVRPYAHNDHYWQVYFDANRVMRSTLAEFPAPTPSQHVVLQQNQG